MKPKSFLSALSSIFVGAGIMATGLMANAPSAKAEELNIYSARSEPLIRPLLDKFTKQTGIRINLVSGKADELLKRLVNEGPNTKADMLITTDAGRLFRAKELGITQISITPEIKDLVQDTYRDMDGHWVGLSLRARPIMYRKGDNLADQISGYEDLAKPEWKGKICIRSSNNIYNQSLMASMIHYHGIIGAQKWADGLVQNFARPPQGGDRDQIRALVAGQCDIAIANTYYLAGMLHSKNDETTKIAEQVAVFWPNQHGTDDVSNRGVHVNVSGAALVRGTENAEAAKALIAFMLSDDSQAWYAKANGEYPVRANIEISETLEKWGDFKADPINLSLLGILNAEAVKLMDRAGWQ